MESKEVAEMPFLMTRPLIFKRPYHQIRISDRLASKNLKAYKGRKLFMKVIKMTPHS